MTKLVNWVTVIYFVSEPFSLKKTQQQHKSHNKDWFIMRSIEDN